MTTTKVTEPTLRDSRQLAEAARESEWERPSFGKELFLGRLRLDLIHPHPRPEDSDREKGEKFLERLEEFLRDHVDPLQIEEDSKIPAEVLKGLCELGALGMNVDEQYGGLGLSHLYYTRALALVGSAHGAIAALLSAHQSIGVPEPLRLFGTEAQKQKYLPRAAKDEVTAFLLTEPDVGSDPARMGMTASPSSDGSEYVLNGTKLWTTNGVIADLLVVMARVPKSEGHRGGISAFIVEAHAPGVTVLHRNQFMGLRGLENGVTKFEDVRVPSEALIGREGMGLKIALTTLNTGRLSLPAICAGATKLALKIAREWSSERVQWGQAIGKHEAVAAHVEYIASTSFALDAVSELTSMLADTKKADIRIEAALAKLYASEFSWLAVDRLVQVRGGRGYETAASLKARGERPVGVEQMLRDLRINRIFEGSSEIMRLFVAREAVDQHLQLAGALVDPEADLATKLRTAFRAGTSYAPWMARLAAGGGSNPRAYREFGKLATHVRFVERSSRKLARSTFYAMARWQGRLEQKQRFLGRIVDIGAELYAMSATCVRAQQMVDDQSSDAASALELAASFCSGARRRVEALFEELWHNSDAQDYAVAQNVLAGRYEWAEAGVVDLSGEGPMLGSGH